MYTFQAVIRKGRPNWFSFFTLRFSFKVTTDAAQTPPWHVYSPFAVPLNTFLLWVWSWLKLFVGTVHFLTLLGLSHCLLDLLQLQPFKETAMSCLFFFPFCNLSVAENTELLRHDTTTYTSSARFPWALQSVKGGEGNFFFPSILVLSLEQLPKHHLLSLTVTQQRLCKQLSQPGWKNPTADCCVNVSHQDNIKMLCYFHSWNEFESFHITVTKQYLTCQLLRWEWKNWCWGRAGCLLAGRSCRDQ